MPQFFFFFFLVRFFRADFFFSTSGLLFPLISAGSSRAVAPAYAHTLLVIVTRINILKAGLTLFDVDENTPTIYRVVCFFYAIMHFRSVFKVEALK